MSNQFFNNGWSVMEADEVYSDMEAHRGLVILNDKWEVMAVFDREGNLWVKGFIAGLHEFKTPSVERKPTKQDEVEYARREKGTLN